MQTPDSPLGLDGGTVEASVFVRGGQARFPAIIVRVGVLDLFVAGKRARPLGRCLRANSSLPLGVPAATNLRSVPAEQVFALLGNVLGDLGQEVQGAEDLKVALGAAADHAAHGARRHWRDRGSVANGQLRAGLASTTSVIEESDVFLRKL